MIWNFIFLVSSIIAMGCFCLWWGYRAGFSEATNRFREMADIEWCPVHFGVINEDANYCDFAFGSDNDDQECKPVAVYTKR